MRAYEVLPRLFEEFTIQREGPPDIIWGDRVRTTHGYLKDHQATFVELIEHVYPDDSHSKDFSLDIIGMGFTFCAGELEIDHEYTVARTVVLSTESEDETLVDPTTPEAIIFAKLLQRFCELSQGIIQDTPIPFDTTPKPTA